MIHYLILAHKGPKQLQKLIEVLSGEKSRVYLHLDAKSNDIGIPSIGGVEYTRHRINIEWGGYSMVAAILGAMGEIFGNMSQQDHLIILSGQDFPIVSPGEIQQFFQVHQDKSFLEYRIQPNSEWNILNRIIKYHFHDLQIPACIDAILKKILSPFYPIHIIRNQVFCYIWQRIVNFFMPARTYLISNYNIYWGSSWMALSQKHISYIMEFIATERGIKYIQYFKTVAGPDEIFFQTILLNSPLRNEIVNNLLWYIDWKKGPGLPRILDDSDYENITRSGKMFARKFEENISDTLSAKLPYKPF